MPKNEPRTFTVTFSENEDGSFNIESENHGLTSLDLLMLLNSKMLDIHRQIVDPDVFVFERVFKDENGNFMKIKEK